ncbi:MAG: L,D-transpeptidase family protein [Thermodesulfobacteriota bacterium]
MKRLIGLMLIFLLAGVPGLKAAPECLWLYTQVTGGEEVYRVERGVHLSYLALKKGVRWSVLARRNQLSKPYRLKPGMVLKIDNSHIVPDELSHGLVINLPELMLYQFYQGAYQRRYALAVGRRSWPTPEGNYYIRNKTKDPTWTVPPSIQEEMAEQGKEVLEKVLPGPENPLGKFWLGTSAPGVGIHATNRPWSVGLSVSHGCIRMLPGEIEQLFPMVEVGMPVKIIYRPIKLALTPSGRIYLEAHPNIYGKKMDAPALVAKVLASYQLLDQVDWEKVQSILKAREGVAQDITKSQGQPGPLTTMLQDQGPRPVHLSPLQEREAKLE